MTMISAQGYNKPENKVSARLSFLGQGRLPISHDYGRIQLFAVVAPRSHFLTGCQLEVAVLDTACIHFLSPHLSSKPETEFPLCWVLLILQICSSGRPWFFLRVHIIRSCPPNSQSLFLKFSCAVQHNLITGATVPSYSQHTLTFEESGRALGGHLRIPPTTLHQDFKPETPPWIKNDNGTSSLNCCDE